MYHPGLPKILYSRDGLLSRAHLLGGDMVPPRGVHDVAREGKRLLLRPFEGCAQRALCHHTSHCIARPNSLRRTPKAQQRTQAGEGASGEARGLFNGGGEPCAQGTEAKLHGPTARA